MDTRQNQEDREELLTKSLIGRKKYFDGPLTVHMPNEVQRFERHENPSGRLGGWVSDGSTVASTVTVSERAIVDKGAHITGHGILEPGYYPIGTVINLDLTKRSDKSA